ncbi:DUF4168 domain-containing protein [Microbulbifer sp. SAOS-129_SWC]|uniref:DUF4168 domain-containing protein n=1 Tax=Microbulbifer sp. SAOS-129_SWC TaxID=3145235 RepID=UPI0032164880
MKTPALILAALTLVLALPTVQAQDGGAKASAQKVSYSEPKLQQFANAYRSIVMLSREYAPKLKAAADIKEAEAINTEAQGKMIAAIKAEGLSKDEYQQIAASIKADPSLLQRVNKILQAMEPPTEQ